jgi:heme-degrading monooxygenase HmoA
MLTRSPESNHGSSSTALREMVALRAIGEGRTDSQLMAAGALEAFVAPIVCVQPKKRSAFEQLMRQVQVALPQVPGCEAVRVMYDVADPTRYTLLEHWSSRERHAAHLAHLGASGEVMAGGSKDTTVCHCHIRS